MGYFEGFCEVAPSPPLQRLRMEPRPGALGPVPNLLQDRRDLRKVYRRLPSGRKQISRSPAGSAHDRRRHEEPQFVGLRAPARPLQLIRPRRALAEEHVVRPRLGLGHPCPEHNVEGSPLPPRASQPPEFPEGRRRRVLGPANVAGQQFDRREQEPGGCRRAGRGQVGQGEFQEHPRLTGQACSDECRGEGGAGEGQTVRGVVQAILGREMDVERRQDVGTPGRGERAVGLRRGHAASG